jgi:hypothetical protein
VGRWRCGLQYRASKSRNARALLAHTYALNLFLYAFSTIGIRIHVYTAVTGDTHLYQGARTIHVFWPDVLNLVT